MWCHQLLKLFALLITFNRVIDAFPFTTESITFTTEGEEKAVNISVHTSPSPKFVPVSEFNAIEGNSTSASDFAKFTTIPQNYHSYSVETETEAQDENEEKAGNESVDANADYESSRAEGIKINPQSGPEKAPFTFQLFLSSKNMEVILGIFGGVTCMLAWSPLFADIFKVCTQPHRLPPREGEKEEEEEKGDGDKGLAVAFRKKSSSGTKQSKSKSNASEYSGEDEDDDEVEVEIRSSIASVPNEQRKTVESSKGSTATA